MPESNVELLVYFLAAAAAAQVTFGALNIAGDLYRVMLRRLRNPKMFGGWALVTGCTAGMGKEYATELAKLGIYHVSVIWMSWWVAMLRPI